MNSLTKEAVMLALGNIIAEIRGTEEYREGEEEYGYFTDFTEISDIFEAFQSNGDL